MKKEIFAGILSIAILSGCATSFDKLSAEKRLSSINVERIEAADASLKKPFKLAIFADMETVESSDEYYESWDWNQTENKLIESYAEDIKKQGVVSSYFIIPEQGHSIQDISSVMKEAESNGADALLAIRGIVKVNWYMNPAALLDPTIIGALWLPGSNRDAMMLSHLDMWNLKNHEVVIAVKADCIRKNVAPTFFISTAKTVDEVKIESLRKLLIEFRSKVTKMKME